MIDKVQKIREEVVKMVNSINPFIPDEDGKNSDYEAGKLDVATQVLQIIDSLEEPVSEDLKEIAWNHADKKCHLDIAVFTSDEVKKEREKMQFTWQDLYDAVMFGAKWQEKKDQSTIELAEDHAMLAGIIKGTEHTIGEVRSILNKVAYRNNGLDVNGDYCEQPYVELDDEFRKLLKED